MSKEDKDLKDYLAALDEKTFQEFMEYVKSLPKEELLNIRKAYQKYLNSKVDKTRK